MGPPPGGLHETLDLTRNLTAFGRHAQPDVGRGRARPSSRVPLPNLGKSARRAPADTAPRWSRSSLEVPGGRTPRLDRAMGGLLKTEAVVLRSIRYAEADRILHLYTPHRGRVGAIAKGVRRARSRFGGRLEPFFRLRIELHEGRGELMTVTGAHTLDGHPRLRADARALDAAARACDAVGRLFETSEPHPAVFNLLCRALSLLDEQAGRTRRGDRSAPALAFRLKLL